MPWNWELPNWPHFEYNDALTTLKEREFLLNVGSVFAYLKTINEEDYQKFVVEILSSEALDSSKIEGEILDRESLQSSIKRHFGMQTLKKIENRKEANAADLLVSEYQSYKKPLSHELLWEWHYKLFNQDQYTTEIGKYRSHEDPMQIISNRYGSSTVYFEVPPSNQVYNEMNRFIEWFNNTRNKKPILIRAAIAHVYFESIHPFEDGNGRIGRALVEKILSESIDRPVLIAVSRILERNKKEYYSALEKCNCSLEVQHWVDFFSDAILKAQDESIKLLFFLIKKSKLLTELSGKINDRQEKVLLRMFAEGLDGFKGGLSAENYIAITKASRATATRDLSELVKVGALTKSGQLRHTRYWLNLT